MDDARRPHPDATDALGDLCRRAADGEWSAVADALARDPALGARAARVVLDPDRRTLLHLAALAGEEAAARALIGLGARTDARDGAGATPADLADGPHPALGQLLREAAWTGSGPWGPTEEVGPRPSSSRWAGATARHAAEPFEVAYGGSIVRIQRGTRYFVDEFHRVLVGWHGTTDPPSGMYGESMVSADG
jgi:uncharacterized protein